MIGQASTIERLHVTSRYKSGKDFGYFENYRQINIRKTTKSEIPFFNMKVLTPARGFYLINKISV